MPSTYVRALRTACPAFAISLLYLACCAGATIASDSGPDMERIEQSLRPSVLINGIDPRGLSLVERMEYYGVPGVSIAVIAGGEVAWARGYGLADVASGRAVDGTTLFQAASMSKSVAAAGALRLVDEGHLDLDLPVSRYLTSWQVPENEFTRRAPVTLRRLLSHSGGLTDDPSSAYAEDEILPTVVQILDGVAPAKTAPVAVDTVPGTHTRYSNSGYAVVQVIMTDTMQREFVPLMQDLVLGRTGMVNSTFAQPLSPTLCPGAATGYMSGGEELPGKHYAHPELAAAGLWTTPTDMARFLIAIMESMKGGGSGLLTRELATEMLTIQSDPYGLGFELDGEGADFNISHGGSNHGFRCTMTAYPSRGEGVVVMTNSDNGSGLYYEVLRAVAHEFGWTGYGSVEKTITPLTSESMAVFTGTYRMDDRLDLVISVDGDHLRMDSPASTFRLFPESPRKFFDVDFGLTLEFVGDAGAVREAILDRGGILMTLPKVE